MRMRMRMQMSKFMRMSADADADADADICGNSIPHLSSPELCASTGQTVHYQRPHRLLHPYTINRRNFKFFGEGMLVQAYELKQIRIEQTTKSSAVELQRNGVDFECGTQLSLTHRQAGPAGSVRFGCGLNLERLTCTNYNAAVN